MLKIVHYLQYTALTPANTYSLHPSGTHLNYYMFFGGYNRGRQAAGGITNFYAKDAALCSSGERHEPKFSHYKNLHQMVNFIASTLLSTETALGKAKVVEVLNEDKTWVIGEKQRMFEYVGRKHVSFVENDENEEVVVRIPKIKDELAEYKQLTLAPTSAVLIVDGDVRFNSASIKPRVHFTRKFANSSEIPDFVGWSFWPETIGAESVDLMTQTGTSPIEQTRLNVDSNVWSDYAWYETSITIGSNDATNAKLFVETQRSNALLAFVDDKFVGATEDHSHLFEGNFTMLIEIGDLSSGQHKLSILSEALGHSNLVGRFGNSGTGPKRKGMTGQIFLYNEDTAKNTSLVDGREWRSYPGLHGERDLRSISANHVNKTKPLWASVLFESPKFNPEYQSLFLHMTTGRGHIWLNGKDLGRYWNITQGDTTKYSQEYYFLPIDYLRTDGNLNEFVIFDAACDSTLALQKSMKLAISWIYPTDTKEHPHFKDEVNYPMACI